MSRNLISRCLKPYRCIAMRLRNWRAGAAFLYLPGSIPWDLMTPIAVGLLRTSISSFAASIDWELALNPW